VTKRATVGFDWAKDLVNLSRFIPRIVDLSALSSVSELVSSQRHSPYPDIPLFVSRRMMVQLLFADGIALWSLWEMPSSA